MGENRNQGTSLYAILSEMKYNIFYLFFDNLVYVYNMS